ncbi:hypothetical protein [Methylobacterium oryzihabitans]|uniref:SMODS and SLOG-associating 2TM effector domain-containing protein n=1 Tax=Methylobacterium oryzihabitans TaxID=2499852 RepID=A0A3S2VCI8_9HYPH|nr:hypothetical protein [Methylobacterium oryzihabitans]RVU19770.1 hypothetical protein EOE48_07420 [Methylobacterium oryzihabitans]
MPNEIRLDEALGDAVIRIEPRENSDDRAERLRRERAESRFELAKRYVSLGMFCTGIIAITTVSVYVAAFDPSASPDTKRWAQLTVSSIITGGLSFILGQATASKSR